MAEVEEWDLVKLYSRAKKSEHYVEAVSLGYQMLEMIFVVLLTKTTVGRGGKPLDEGGVRKADNLLAKAKLALEHEFIDQALFDELAEWNRSRRDIIHNMVAKNVTYEQVQACALKIGPLYFKVQSLFLTITAGKPKSVG